MENTLLASVFLGILEGLTEFIPVSSTGHLLLAQYFLKFQSQGKVFEVFIQLGAILALPFAYYNQWNFKKNLLKDYAYFAGKVLIAFLPAAFIGFFAHGFIKSVLFETPTLICIMLIIGGGILIGIDRYTALKPHHYFKSTDFPIGLCLQIGFFQCLAMIPGVSRSGVTICTALLNGADRKSAVEFSFFLAVPTLLGASCFDLFKNEDVLSLENASLFATGFFAAFVTALFAIHIALNCIKRYGYSGFGWWRIGLGSAGLIALYS